MLGKLIKTDLKSTARLFLPLCGAIMALCITMVLCMKVMPESDLGNLTKSITYVIYNIAIFAFSVLAFFVPILRFRSCIMKDEAYLMLSIPIKPWMHLVSKLICSLIWVTASRICKYIVSMVMAAAAGEDANHMNSSFAMLFGEQMNTKKILIWNFCMELLLVITIQLFTYLVSIISAKSAKHRRGLSVAYTIGGTVLMSWGFGAVLMLYFKHIAPESRVSNVADGLITVYIPSIIYLAVLSVAFYTASALILTKKFDLL